MRLVGVTGVGVFRAAIVAIETRGDLSRVGCDPTSITSSSTGSLSETVYSKEI